jgi:hypothetical protein
MCRMVLTCGMGVVKVILKRVASAEWGGCEVEGRPKTLGLLRL